jgi:hypothetical protein
MTFGVEKLKKKLVSAENCEETEFGVREIDVIQVKGERKANSGMINKLHQKCIAIAAKGDDRLFLYHPLLPFHCRETGALKRVSPFFLPPHPLTRTAAYPPHCNNSPTRRAQNQLSR